MTTRRALASWGGDLLEGFVVRGAPAFEEWAETSAATLRREVAATLGALAVERETEGDRVAALSLVRRWLALDPLHEPAHQALIRLLAATGDRAGALVAVPGVRAHPVARARRTAAA